ncbi:MAG: hypothetical protein H6Q90_7212, partial [Deltaproteobacteria bacterium]|nr:hypothetical protein [Deltaproteobacteria bacterium]
MRAAIVVAIVIGARLAVAQPVATQPVASPPATTPVGFDHVIHNRDVLLSGGESIACTACHVMRAGVLT